MAELPSFEQLAGPPPKEPEAPSTTLPTFEQLAGPPPDRPKVPPQGGPANDAFWSWQGNKLARIMTQFGQGAEHGYGAGRDFVDKAPEMAMQALDPSFDMKAYKEKLLAQQGLVKAGNEAWMRTALRSMYGEGIPGYLQEIPKGVAGGVMGALESASAGFQQIGKEMIGAAKEQQTGREDLLQQGHTLPIPDILTPYVGGYGELTAATAAGQYFGPGSGIAPEIAPITTEQALAATHPERTLSQYLGLSDIPPSITQARAAGAIGEDIDVFLGSREPSFDEWQGRLKAIGDSPGAAAQPAVDIHQMAQMIAPDVFKRWQTLEEHRDILTQHLEGLTALKARDETVSKLTGKIERLAKKTEGPATPLNREDREALAKAKSDLETYHDTPSQDILDARAALKRVNDERNQLAPDVKRAYQEAQGRVTPLDLTRSLEGETFNPADTVPPEAGKPSAVFSAVREQMLAAGRSEEEANAAALVTQHRYETRSKRFPQLGTAEEIFNKERLSIKAGEGKPSEGTVFNQEEIDNVVKLSDVRNKKKLEADLTPEEKEYYKAYKDPDATAESRQAALEKLTNTAETNYQAKIDAILENANNIITKAYDNGLVGIWKQWNELHAFVTEFGKDIFTDEELNGQYQDLLSNAKEVINRYNENIKKPGENVVPLRKPGEVTLEQSKFIKSYDEAIKLFRERMDETEELWHQEMEKVRDLYDEYKKAETGPSTPEKLKEVLSRVLAQDAKEKEASSVFNDAIKEFHEAESAAFQSQFYDVKVEKVLQDLRNRRNKSETAYIHSRSVFHTIVSDLDKFIEQNPDYLTLTDPKKAARLEKLNDALAEADHDSYELFKAWKEDSEALDNAIHEQPFFQEGARADITFQKDGQSVIRLFKNADSSSIFHELGHKWLEELRADAEHPQAPEQLKKDWKTVQDFYGIKKKITKTQHENWARGFERYLMEGIAPSKELEAVFKQLKDWLVGIYQKVLALKAPINDDIRAVMDRLLATDDAVITGETTPRAPPKRVKKEVITDPEGQVKDLAPDDQVEGANDELPSKGTYMQDDGKISDLDIIDSYKSIRDAAEEFGELNAQAMNIRKGKLGKTDIVEISQLTGIPPRRIEGLIESMQKTYVKDRVSPTKKVLFLGVFLKQNAARIKDIMEKPNATPKEMAKVIGWITQHKAAIETMLGLRTEWGLTGHALQALLEESLASGGDAAFNQSLLNTIGLSIQQLGKRLRIWKPKTTNQVSVMSRRITDPSLGKSLVQYYINGLISGPFTHLQYALGNELTTIKNEIVEPGISAAVGGIRAALGDTRERVTFDEMVARQYALTVGSRDGLIAAGKAIREGYQQGFDSDDMILAKVLDELDTKKITPADKDNRISELTNKVQLFNRLHDVEDIRKDEERTVTNLVRIQKGQKAIPLRIDPDLNEVFSIIERAEPPQSFYTESRENIAARKGVSGTFQHVINAPGERMVSPIHTVNYIQNLTTNLYGRITRSAFAEGRAKGWTQDEINRRITEHRIDPPLEMIRSAREDALRSSLLSKPGDFFSKMNLWLSHEFNTPGLGPTPWLKLAQPFVTISSLVWKGGSILGRYMVPGGILIRKGVRDDMFGRNGKIAQDLAIGKAVAGYGLFWALWEMSAQGLLNRGPADTYQENIYRTMYEGLPYGVRIGDMTYEAEKLGPIGFYASIVSDLYHFREHAGKQEYISSVEELMYQMGHHLTSTGPVSGIADLFEAMKEPGRYGQGYANQLAVALATPLSVGMSQVAHQIDPYQREVTTGGETVTANMSGGDAFMVGIRNEMNRLKKQWVKNIPYASTSLYPQRDIFGQPMPNRQFYGVYASEVQKDPVFQAFDKIGYFPAPIPKRIGNFTLTEEMYDKLASKAGVLAHQFLTQSVSAPNWKQTPPGIQHKMLVRDVTLARSLARTYLEGEYQDIMKTNAEFKAAITKPLPGEEPEGPNAS